MLATTPDLAIRISAGQHVDSIHDRRELIGMKRDNRLTLLQRNRIQLFVGPDQPQHDARRRAGPHLVKGDSANLVGSDFGIPFGHGLETHRPGRSVDGLRVAGCG